MADVKCRDCGRRLYSKTDREQGRCSTCEVASWTPEKRAEINALIGRAWRATSEPPSAGSEAKP